MSRFIEAKVITADGEEEFFAMHKVTAERIKREGYAPSHFHTNAGEFYEVESITIEGRQLNIKPEE